MDGALVDIGYKAEGFCTLQANSRNWEEAKIGDKIQRIPGKRSKNENSMPELSMSKAYSIKAWEKSYQRKTPKAVVVKGVMKHRVKGGIIVDVDGVEAFLPGSQIDIGPCPQHGWNTLGKRI